jgi:putative nucleotidyltransferase with HDIG domain/PAS domain S-box-containing protein
MPKKILIVEDDSTISILISKFIAEFGYESAGQVSTYEGAIQSAFDANPDLILMDIQLDSTFDGVDAALKIKEKSDVPVVFITSSTDSATIERVAKINSYGYIIKPIDKNELKVTIQMAFLRHKMDNQIDENNQKFSTILDCMTDSVFVTDYNGYLTYANSMAKSILCKNDSEILDRLLLDVVAIEKGLYEKIEDCSYIISASGEKIPIDYSASPIKDAKGNTSGAVLVLRDISERIQSEIKLKESLQSMRKTMGGVIQAMTLTVESRDPYTAGHQKRVSSLARIIAQEMHLSVNIIESIRMAGIIHDLGKISIPAEILSKPGKLTDIEFSLMKTHSQTGYDILKTIEFPWPVADIIYQHHEKLDGSGYPRGLKGGEILLESRILCVADVVEAISSHRPYRPSLGISIAVEEITKNRGIMYDKDVVDICIEIVTRKGFNMDKITDHIRVQ